MCEGIFASITWCADAQALLPLVVLGSGILLLLLVEAFSKSFPASSFAATILLVSLFSTMTSFEMAAGGSALAFNGMIYVDQLSHSITFLLLLGALITVLLGAFSLDSEKIEERGDFYSLYLLTTFGAIVFANAAEFITLFLALELMSMPLYCMCGASLRSARSAESALKYFFLGSFSSAFLLFGIALLFGLTGSLHLTAVAEGLAQAPSVLGYVAIGLVLIGIVFKLAAVPFHFWAPDVYQGAPTIVTAFMSTVVKATAVIVAMRVLWIAFGGTEALLQVWTAAVWVIAVLTMVFGNLLAIQQRSMKRMLAYSSIAHAGYMMMALLAPGDGYGASAILFYILTYSVITLGAFGVLMVVVGDHATDADGDDITRFNRLGYTRPFMAALMSLFMFALAGLPPGMAGLLGKFYIFNSAVRSGFTSLAIIGVLASAVSCFYYLRVVIAMYFVPEQERDEREPGHAGALTGALLTGCGALVIALGLFPEGLYTFVEGLVSSSALR